MITRHRNTFLALIVLTAFLAVFYSGYKASADDRLTRTSKQAAEGVGKITANVRPLGCPLDVEALRVEAAQAATERVRTAAHAVGAAAAASLNAKYPDNEDGKAAVEADAHAGVAESAAWDAVKAAAEARRKACESGSADDAKAAGDAEKAAQDAEARADAAAAAADVADSKADPNGPQLDKKLRDARGALRAAYKRAKGAICFASECVEQMDESTQENRNRKAQARMTLRTLDVDADSPFYALAPPLGAVQVQTGQGLHKITYATTFGRVIVNLPDDIRAGDTISGTVIAEPKGDTREERAKNSAALSGYVIEVETPKKPDGTSIPKIKVQVNVAPSPLTITLPPSSPPTPPLKSVSSGSSSGLGITLTNTSGSFTTGGTTTIPIEIVHLSLQSVEPLKVPQLPTIGQQGRPIEIIGPFDGNTANTRLMYGPARSSIQDFEKNTENVTGGFGLLQPLAESPRKCVLTAPTNVSGPIELFVKDVKTETVAPYRNVGVNLTAPKTNLTKGEHTELHVEVNGLQGIKEPVPLTLQSSGVITMEGGMYQPLWIQPSQVGSDGRYTTTRGITGVQTGGWTSTATVVTQPFDIVLRDPDPPQTLLVNSFTGDYAFCGAGQKLTGTGQVQRKGCVITLTDNRPDRRIFGTLDGCAPGDNGRYWTLTTPGTNVEMKLTVSDTASKAPTKLYFNPQNKVFAPIQDVSAFATCP